MYRLFAYVMSPENDLAQSACNLTFNDQLVTTIQTNGTEGKWVTQKLVKVELEAGVYELKFEFVKPGIEVKHLELRKV